MLEVIRVGGDNTYVLPHVKVEVGEGRINKDGCFN